MTNLDLELLRAADKYSDDLDSLISNYKKLHNGISAGDPFVYTQTKYTEADLVSFGNYLLSEQRAKGRVQLNGVLYLRMNTEVYHADLCNWKDGVKC